MKLELVKPDLLQEFVLLENKEHFEDCSELKEIEIPYNVKKLPHLLFMRCTSIENIYLPYGFGRNR